ncbi:TetR family transcriptional regulator [Asanoa ishikariensis]|uniref:Transcriptional regulator, TetR family n=1 Tax=Asanoa ishikariensis TaxID=137265 RepID=A0A1H3TGD2_9ACTN|nr:TetR/AcrR family transcriptional regulator [Asanoa ishikariensis]GIF62522.1 TetR family transcriptional regulator [Asanoa ishikariensis]SDZ49037.1 transcriptional regulator, TetR family [Asanoa ishikariensis]
MPDENTSPSIRADARENRRQLIDATRAAIATRGLEISALDIATAAGVGVGTLYRRFGTKEALLDAVVIGLYDEMVELAQVCLERPDAWDGLTEFMTELVTAHRDSLGLAEFTAHDERQSPDIAQRTLALQDAVRLLAERAHATGDLREDVTWQDLLLCSRAPLDTDHCLGVDGGPEGWRRILTLLLDGMRAPGRTPLAP